MHQFVTHNGSYTLVLKPEGASPVYDHKGNPVRVEGVKYIDFKFTKGTSVGVFKTQDDELAERLRNHPLCGRSFTEVKKGQQLPATASAITTPVKVPKTALMACRKDELIEMAEQYKIEIDKEEDTKKTIVDKIIAAQEKPVVSKDEPTKQIEALPGEIRTIKQEAKPS